MKQVHLSLNVEQYRELTKLVTLGTHVIICSGEYNRQLIEDVECEVCKTGYEQAGETGIYEKGIPTNLPYKDPDFLVTSEFFDECEEIEESYQTKKFNEQLAIIMGYKDFVEKYGIVEEDELIKNNDYVNFIISRQDFYKQEFLLNGKDNLRYVQQEA